MIRICLRCNAYYADDALAFCFADGTPLVNLDPSSEHWSEGVRAVKVKENALKKVARNLKWRRVMMTSLTTFMVTMVVFVVVVNSYIYLKPSSPSPSPPSPSPTLSPSPSPTPSPSASPTPSPSTSPSPSPTPTPTPTPECSETDKQSERTAIVDKYGDVWRAKATAYQPKVIDEVIPGALPKRPEVNLKKVDIKRVINTCTSASINVTYVWEVIPVQTNPHIRPEARKAETKTQFNYVKVRNAWRPK